MRHAPSALQRRWSDLRITRLAWALSLASAGPALVTMALFLAAYMWFEDPTIIVPPVRFAAAFVAVAVIWTLGSGLIALAMLGRWRRVIGRTTCLLVGCIGAALFPTAGFSVIRAYQVYVLDWWIYFKPEDLQYLGLLGLAALPFGLFGGWVLWRVGVRPAVTKTFDLAPVFD